SWKVYHKAVRSDKQEGGASLACGSSTASSAAHTGPLGHRAAGCDGPASPETELFTTFLKAGKCLPSAAQQATCERLSGQRRETDWTMEVICGQAGLIIVYEQ
ncbi:hypothetical protein IRJ41_021659, partial [Triplophysa rosa]